MKGVLFIGGVADGKWIAVPNKPSCYKVPIPPPRPLRLTETVPVEDTIYYYDSYYLHWWFDGIPIYIEEHMGPADALKRLAHYYRPENQDGQ